jgi:hypothetical protein
LASIIVSVSHSTQKELVMVISIFEKSVISPYFGQETEPNSMNPRKESTHHY